MTSRIGFTEPRILDMDAPAKGRVYVFDVKVPNLCCCVTAAGTKTYYVRYKLAGQSFRVRIGDVGKITVDAARTAAKDMMGQVARGVNPQAERREKRQEPTLGVLWQHWLEYAKGHKRSWKGDEWLWKKYLKPWENRRLGSIKRSDVQTLHSKLGRENGIYAANRMLSLLRSMFNKSVDIGYRGENPAKGIKPFKEQSRDRFLSAEELERFFVALHQDPSADMQDVFLLALLSGARRGNVLAMRWEDVDLRLAQWRIPESVAKGGATLIIPLVPAAVELLQRRRLAGNGSPWVFPSRGKTGHLVEVKGGWKRVLTRAGLADLRPHDLRRTLGSWQAMQGASLQVIGKSLGHQQIATTMIYSRLSLDPVRESVKRATNEILTHDVTPGDAAVSWEI
jgi:integrase